jgi:phosphonoacetaldehyde hydrolase
MNTVQAIIFDLSGTLIDFGSRGPVLAFVELCRRHGIQATEAQARGPMGSRKWDHIWAMLNEPAIHSQWVALKGQPPTFADVDALYPEFTEVQIATLVNHVEVLPGITELVAELDRRGIAYATTTGFESSMMAPVKASLTAAGFNPAIYMTPDLVGTGRPAPWMIFHAAKQMGRYPLHHFIKVGDTEIDIAEAEAAGTWAVSVLATGNEIGLSKEALAALPLEDREERFHQARAKFKSLGAHYVIDYTADLPPVVDDINRRLANGERP